MRGGFRGIREGENQEEQTVSISKVSYALPRYKYVAFCKVANQDSCMLSAKVATRY